MVFVGVFVSRASLVVVVVIIPLVCMLKGGQDPLCDDLLTLNIAHPS